MRMEAIRERRANKMIVRSRVIQKRRMMIRPKAGEQKPKKAIDQKALKRNWREKMKGAVLTRPFPAFLQTRKTAIPIHR